MSIFGLAMLKRYLMSPGLAAPYSKTNIFGYQEGGIKIKRNNDATITLNQNKRRGRPIFPQFPKTANGIPNSLLKFSRAFLTRHFFFFKLSQCANTENIAAFAEVL